MSARRDLQIAHIQREHEKFYQHQGEERHVAGYFQEYLDPEHPDDLYLNLCNDLGLTPEPEALPPEAPPKRVRHKWVHLREHVYICRKCGTGRVNVELGENTWAAHWFRPDGSETVGLTPPCEIGPRTAAYLEKYADRLGDPPL